MEFLAVGSGDQSDFVLEGDGIASVRQSDCRIYHHEFAEFAVAGHEPVFQEVRNLFDGDRLGDLRGPAQDVQIFVVLIFDERILQLVADDGDALEFRVLYGYVVGETLLQGFDIQNGAGIALGGLNGADLIQDFHHLHIVLRDDVRGIASAARPLAFRELLIFFVFGEFRFQLTEIVFETEAAGERDHRDEDGESADHDRHGERIALGRSDDFGLRFRLIPIHQDPSPSFKQRDDGWEDERHREPGHENACRGDETEFGEASEVGENEHKQGHGGGGGGREDRRARGDIGRHHGRFHILPIGAHFQVASIEVDAVIDAQSEQDHKKHGGHRVEHAQIGVGDAERINQAQEQWDADDQNGNRSANDVTEKPFLAFFFRATTVIDELLAEEIEHHQKQYAADA